MEDGLLVGNVSFSDGDLYERAVKIILVHPKKQFLVNFNSFMFLIMR